MNIITVYLYRPPVCPEDGEAVSENDVRVDKGCAKEIKSLKAFCAGYDHGCKWSGPIDEAEVQLLYLTSAGVKYLMSSLKSL